jgi:hypothetical protein
MEQWNSVKNPPETKVSHKETQCNSTQVLMYWCVRHKGKCICMGASVSEYVVCVCCVCVLFVDLFQDDQVKVLV